MRKRGIKTALRFCAALAILLALQQGTKAGCAQRFQARVVEDTVELKWDPDGQMREVLFSISEKGPYASIGQTDTGKFTYYGGVYTGRLWFAQRAANSQETMQIISVEKADYPVKAPSNLRAKRLKNDVIALSWQGIKGAEEYEILQIHKNGNTTTVGLTRKTSYEFVSAENVNMGIRAWKGVEKSRIVPISIGNGGFAGTVLPFFGGNLGATGTEGFGRLSFDGWPPLLPATSPAVEEPQATTAPAEEASVFQAAELERAVFDEINARRRKLKLPEIQYNAGLHEAARFRAKELAEYEYFEHVSKTYEKLELCAETYTGRRPWWVAECLMWGSSWEFYNDAEKIVDLWRKSESHWEALTTPEVSEGGIGAALSQSGELYVVAFPVQWLSN